MGDAKLSSHIVKSYDTELATLDRTTAEMGGLAERLLADAFEALSRRDPDLAQRAAASDRDIDLLERRLQERAINLIAKRQPMANDLRHVLTLLKIGADLERIGDLAKNIAKRGAALAAESHPKALVGGLGHMTELALKQLKDVLDALSARDAGKAVAVWTGDAGLDVLYNSVFRELLTYMMEDPRNISLCAHLLFAAKNLERIGDHTTNIAENVHFLVTGTMLADDRPKGDDTASVLISKPTS
jgi:phosphate transport system protein